MMEMLLRFVVWNFCILQFFDSVGQVTGRVYSL